MTWIPPWMDTPTLARHICVSEQTVMNWVSQGILPAPRKRGGKLLWKWSEVDERLTVGEVATINLAERIRNASAARN